MSETSSAASPRGAAIDAGGNAWFTGLHTNMPGMMTDWLDAFVAKVNADGTLAFTLTLGGGSFDAGESIAIDAGGNAWVVGETASAGWAANGFDSEHAGAIDAFVAKISPTGTLLSSSYIGGSGNDSGGGIAVDAAGNVWVTGEYDGTPYSASDAFVMKIDTAGAATMVSSLGGAATDAGNAIAITANGDVIVVGETRDSAVWWTNGGFDTTHNGGADGFVARLSSSGGVIWSSYIGGAGDDYAQGVAIDAAGDIWVTGDTASSGWAIGGHDTTHGGGDDAFIAKVSGAGVLAWSTYLGGEGEDSGESIVVGSDGTAWVAGVTQSSGWVAGGFDTTHGGGKDAFMARILADGGAPWSTYMGGFGDDAAGAVAVGGDSAWVAGGTAGGWGDVGMMGYSPAFAARIHFTPVNPPSDLTLSSQSVPEGLTPGTVVGNFSAIDADAGETFTYSLVAGTGGADNASFTISGNQLRTDGVFDANIKDTYLIRVRVTDSSGAFLDKPFTITVTSTNSAPTAMALSSLSVPGGEPAGTLVGRFSTTDPDAGETFTYALVTGAGGVDNTSFTISGNQLRTAAVFNANVKGSYSIRVRVTDSGGLSFEQPFTITVTASGRVIEGEPGWEWLARQAAYDDQLQQGNLVNGYVVDRVFSDTVTGFHALGLLSSTYGPMLLCRGTEPTQLADLLADADPNGIGHGQFAADRANVEAWLGLQAAAVDFVGHSLGGALAQLFAAAYTWTNHRIDQVVTFNSPGISHDWANRFDPADANRVMHYVVNGDLVSMAGEQFIEGQYTLASYRALNLLSKHQTTLLDDAMTPVNEAGGVSLAAPKSTSSLNSDWFMYSDPDYLIWLGMAEVLLWNTSFATVPPKLLFRCTTEQLRTQAANQIRAITIAGPDGTTTEIDVSLPAISADIWLLRFRAEDLHFHYNSATGNIFIQGDVTLPSLFNTGVTVRGNFAGPGNGIWLIDGKWGASGEVSISDITIIPGKLAVDRVAVQFNTDTKTIQVDGTLTIWDYQFHASVGLVNGTFDSIALDVDNLNIHLGYGIFLQKLGGSIQGLSHPETFTLTGNIAFTFGKQVSIDLPSWMGGDRTISLFRWEGQGTIGPQGISGTGTTTCLGGVASVQGELELYWAPQFYFRASGSYSSALGIIQVDAALVINNANSMLNIVGAASGSVNIPDYIPFLSDMRLNVGMRLEFTDDNIYSNDYFAGWARVGWWIFKADIGFRVWFDGDTDFIGAKTIKALRKENASTFHPAAALAADTGPMAWATFAIAPDEPYALVAVTCEQNASTADIRLRAPDGTLYTAADLLDGSKVKIVDELSTNTRKTVAINAPAAGVWTVEVANSSTLSNVDFECYGAAPQPVVTLGQPQSTDAGRTITLPYTLANLAPDTQISFYYDTDASGFDGVLIGQTNAKSSGTYRWKTAGVPEGDYRIYAVVESPNLIPVNSEYAAASVHVPTSLGFGMVNGKVIKQTVVDSDGDLVTLSLTGGGTGWLIDGSRIQLTGTTAGSVLKISVKRSGGGDGLIWLAGLTSDGPLKSISATQSLFYGELSINTSNAPAAANSAVAISLGQVNNATISSLLVPISSLRVLDWSDTDEQADTLTAPSIGSIKVSGRAAKNGVTALAGDLEANISANAITSVSVAGTLRSEISTSGIISAISAKAGIDDSTIVATGGIKSLTAALLANSAVLVGVRHDFAGRFAARAADFTAPAARLAKLSITGRKELPGVVPSAYMVFSHVSAPAIGQATLMNVAQTSSPVLHVSTDTGTIVLKRKPGTGSFVLDGGTSRPGSRTEIWQVLA